MTTVTDSDIKEIKEAIAALAKKIGENDSDIKEIKEAIAALAKQMAENDKNISVKITELSGKIDTTNARIDSTNAKIDGLDKRLSILEAIYQRFFNVMLGFLGTGLAGIVLKFIWDNFKFVV